MLFKLQSLISYHSMRPGTKLSKIKILAVLPLLDKSTTLMSLRLQGTYSKSSRAHCKVQCKVIMHRERPKVLLDSC